MINFTIDSSWKADPALMSYLEEKLELVGLDIFRYTLNYLSVFDLLELVDYSPGPISRLAEDLLLRQEITVKRMGISKSKYLSIDDFFSD